MKNIQKIAIIGSPGSGKSTLALELHKKLGLPLYHLDQYFWKPNWGQPNPEEYKIIHDTLCQKESWIIDGMNLRLLEYRIQQANVIIYLDVPRYRCFWRIFKRTITYYGKEAPSSAEKCPEGFSWKFVQFLKWVWGFKAKYPPKIKSLLATYASTKQIYILRSHKELHHFIKSIETTINTE